jgi:hypothetical protein
MGRIDEISLPLLTYKSLWVPSEALSSSLLIACAEEMLPCCDQPYEELQCGVSSA